MWWIVAIFLILGAIAFFAIGALGIVIDPTVAFVISAIIISTMVSIVGYILYLRWKRAKIVDDLDESRKFAEQNYVKYENEVIKSEVHNKKGYSMVIKIPHVFGEDEIGAHLMFVASGERNAGQPVVMMVRLKPLPFRLLYKQRFPEPGEIDKVFSKYDGVGASKAFEELLMKGRMKVPFGGQNVIIGTKDSFFDKNKEGTQG